MLPTKWPSHAWGCAKGVSVVSCPEPALPPDPFQACWPNSFWTLLELVRTLPVATNRKMHELANPKREFIIRMQGRFMHFKGWEAAKLQRLELQIVRLSLSQVPLLLLMGLWLYFFSLSPWNIFLYGIHVAIKQTNTQKGKTNVKQNEINTTHSEVCIP